MQLLIQILLGALVGFIAGKLMDTAEKGFIMNAIIGLVGSAIGGLINHFFHFGTGFLTGAILSIIGSCILIFVVNKLFKQS